MTNPYGVNWFAVVAFLVIYSTLIASSSLIPGMN